MAVEMRPNRKAIIHTKGDDGSWGEVERCEFGRYRPTTLAVHGCVACRGKPGGFRNMGWMETGSRFEGFTASGVCLLGASGP